MVVIKEARLHEFSDLMANYDLVDIGYAQNQDEDLPVIGIIEDEIEGDDVDTFNWPLVVHLSEKETLSIHKLIFCVNLHEYDKLTLLHNVEKNYITAGFSLFLVVVIYGPQGILYSDTTEVNARVSSLRDPPVENVGTVVMCPFELITAVF
ncbi:unnamed protein product [Spodoptera exigua]|nr:unnamed protein product [Spodoptera exigua]